MIWSYRRLNIFPTFIPWPENYDFNIPIVPSIPHQRVMLSRNTKDHDFLGMKKIITMFLKILTLILAGGLSEEHLILIRQYFKFRN